MTSAPTSQPSAGRAGSPWDDNEDYELLSKVEGGTPLVDIATQHSRTMGAVQNRLYKLVKETVARGVLTLDEACARYKVSAADLTGHTDATKQRKREKRSKSKAAVAPVPKPVASATPPAPAPAPSRAPTKAADKPRAVAGTAAAGLAATRESLTLLREIRDYLKVIARSARREGRPLI